MTKPQSNCIAEPPYPLTYLDHTQEDKAMQVLKPSLSAEDASEYKSQQDLGQVSNLASSEIQDVQDSVQAMEVVLQK